MDHSTLLDAIKHFRRSGGCPTCSSRMGVQCPRCDTYTFPGENYCPSCGWTVTKKEVPSAVVEQRWSEHEAAVLKQAARQNGKS